MGSMNTNNWLSFPLSPTDHPSLQTHLHSSNPHQHFSLGLVSESMDNPFQTQEWNLLNAQGSNEVPKVADFLGVSKSENQSEHHHNHHHQLVSFNEIQGNNDHGDYMFSNTSLVPVQDTLVAPSNTTYDFQENPNNLQSLTLSMGSASGGSKASTTCETSGENSTNSTTVETAAAPRRTLDTFGQRTSIYRGVTRHRWTGRYEAHLWDNSCRREGQSRKGRQVYLGGYDKEEKAARAYDMAALKYWGTSTTTNFPITNYEKEVEDMKNMTRQEFVASIRRKSSGFSRGASMYRGVTRHHQHGRWQARIGRVAGNKDLYLGTFSTEEEAAEAYDIAAIKFRGLNAVTNFDMSRYDVKSILESNTLPIGGGAAKRLKEAQAIELSRKREEMIALGSGFTYGTSSNSSHRLQPYSLIPFEQQPQTHHQTQVPLLTLHDQDHMSQYTQDAAAASSFQHNYLQTQLHLHNQSATATGFLQNPTNPTQFYNGYVQANPGLIHGLFNMGNSSSTPVMENSSGSYSGGGYMGNGLGMGSNSGGSNPVGSAEELALVKVDYDMPSGGYGSWSGESNPGVFTMWNEQ